MSRRLLSTHPSVLQRVRDEISTQIGNTPESQAEITYEGLRKLTYLPCVLKEGQYPSKALISMTMPLT